MEFLCFHCSEWHDTANCESHFSGAHGKTGVTFEKLKARLSAIGGLSVRDEYDEPEPEKATKPFVTNNFQHNL